jgi:predicted membrane channel-forming protein YqfA (hemolysin III family)
MKKLSETIRITFLGFLFICVIYCAVRTIDIVSWNDPIPVEVAIIALSLITGIVMTPIISMFLQRQECRNYMLYIVIGMTILLVVTYQFRTRWHNDPQFLTLSLCIPGVISHFVGLHVLLHKNPENANRNHSTHHTI